LSRASATAPTFADTGRSGANIKRRSILPAHASRSIAMLHQSLGRNIARNDAVEEALLQGDQRAERECQDDAAPERLRMSHWQWLRF